MPQPLHDQEPLTGCGPNLTDDPLLTVADAVCCQEPPLTCKYGVIVVGAQLPPDELLLEDELDELPEPPSQAPRSVQASAQAQPTPGS